MPQSTLTCQIVSVSGLPSGTVSFRVRINGRRNQEATFADVNMSPERAKTGLAIKTATAYKAGPQIAWDLADYRVADLVRGSFKRGDLVNFAVGAPTLRPYDRKDGSTGQNLTYEAVGDNPIELVSKARANCTTAEIAQLDARKIWSDANAANGVRRFAPESDLNAAMAAQAEAPTQAATQATTEDNPPF
jgi:hypothetical protein